jgi:predicted nucleotidyltransferase
MSAEDLLTPEQRVVARRVLDEESARREHVVVYLSGAHAYGFPSPDSDLDLKAIHAAPTASLLGLSPAAVTFDRAEVLDGVEIDYTSNEIGAAIAGILAGNGNFAERVLGACALVSSEALTSLRPLVEGALSRRFHRHYRGFATSQLKELEAKPTAKRALYVLRTALTGTHLLRTGALVTDVNELLDAYAFGEARALIAAKRAGERTPLDGAVRDHWRAELARAFTLLDDARASSPLPEEPPNVAELEAWLLALRRARF